MFDTQVLRDKKVRNWLVIFFVGGFLAGLPIDGPSFFNQITGKELPNEWRQGTVGLINPLLGLNYPDKNIFDELEPLQERLSSLVQREIQDGNATRMSIYLKDETTSHWTGVNETGTYAPASLTKIPMMMIYFKLAETTPSILNKTILFTGTDLNKLETFKSAKNMIVGQYYSVNNLIERMIVYSDNNALIMLYNDLDKKTMYQIFTDLGITVPENVSQPGDYITPGNFSRFFRTLYNSTYLNEEYSQKALELLSKSDFKYGLVAGVPADVTVAHKFGESVDVDTAGKTVGYELHDCGIVYIPAHPYLICVMTTGTSYDTLTTAIKDVSNMVYTAVKNNYK